MIFFRLFPAIFKIYPCKAGLCIRLTGSVCWFTVPSSSCASSCPTKVKEIVFGIFTCTGDCLHAKVTLFSVKHLLEVECWPTAISRKKQITDVILTRTHFHDEYSVTKYQLFYRIRTNYSCT